MKNLRTATAEDFKVGAKFMTSEGYTFVLAFKYSNTPEARPDSKVKSKFHQGVWEARFNSGMKCIFESEAHHYKFIN